MSRYAAKTTVTVENSRRELEKILERYGATSFVYGHEPGRAMIQFAMVGRHVRFDMPIPPLGEFALTPGGVRRTSAQQESARDQAVRQRWRALVLVTKAKLEAVESGLTTFEEEFLAHVVLPDNSTVGQWAALQLEEVYGSGQMPGLLPGAGGAPALPQGGTTR